MTLDRILTDSQRALLEDERRLLAEVAAALDNCEAAPADRATLAGSVAQLDHLFLIVVVGEFNSGKSALINALLGERVLAEGVTPTTSKIHLLRHGEAVGREPIDAVQEVLTCPLELLREVTIVDTPGTNALDRRHEAVTAEFVPRSDLVLFVTSADRPYSESERAFLERIRAWGKKIVVVVNKTDIIRSRGEVDQIVGYVREHGRRLLATEPSLFAVSSLTALEARATGDQERLAASGLPDVERFLYETLDDGERIRLKLGNPLGVAANLVGRCRAAADELLATLADDLKTLDDVERQLAAYAEDVDRELRLRLADVDREVHLMERRGLDFFDERVRLRRLPELVRGEAVRADFERQVVADTPQRIEAKVESMIDWLVSSDLRQWQGVVGHVSRRQAAHAGRVVGGVGSAFEADRAGLLERVRGAARQGLARYDRAAEARRVADQVQRAVAGTALVEAGAVGLGATISLLIGGSAADATGLLAAGTVAALGLYILPHRRRRAKRELMTKLARLRDDLRRVLEDGFGSEAERSRLAIWQTVAPYERFVRSERGRLQQRQQEMQELAIRIESVQARVAALR